MRRNYYKRRRRYRRRATAKFFVILVFFIAVLGTGAYFIINSLSNDKYTMQPVDNTGDGVEVAIIPKPDDSQDPTTTPSETPTESPVLSLSEDLKPSSITQTHPEHFGFETKVYVDNEEQESYLREGSVDFGLGSEYTALEGVTTYRGNNYRDASSWGTADITDETFTLLDIDKTTSTIGKWGGCACTGQPLVVKWTGKTLENMNDMLKDDFKDRDELIEVVIASVDGNIYFMELSTGIKTRDFISIGSPTKGTPSLDPRGYPIIYVGQGLSPEGSPNNQYNDMYFRVYSLIDGKELYNFGAPIRDPKAYRTDWQAYDASPLIDAATDTLIEPGENGVLYTVKLNTQYDEEAGTLTMNPDPKVKYTYTSTRNESANGGKGVWGVENSPVGWRNYLFFTDNIGMLQCVDLNTMELVYANDMGNDSDVTMVLEEDLFNDTFYLYTGSEFDDTVVDATTTTGTCYASKIDGLTGSILWDKDFEAFTEIGGNVDGGILGSPILGREGTTMEGLIIYTVSNMVLDDGSETAMVVALDKETGEVAWQVDMENDGWTPSSPVPVYTDAGQGYIVQCLHKGTIKLIRVDGDTASVVDSINVSEENGTEENNNFEATPVVYGNTIVVGSRSAHFFYLEIN